MTNILKLSLAAVAIAALAACGGGDSTEPADKYVGNWKSSCYQDTATSGNIYYYINKANYAKVSAGEIMITATYDAHSDTACASKVGSGNLTTRKMNIGAETTFLGAKADVIALITVSTGEAFPGYATTDGTKLNIITYAAGGSASGWGKASPYTKQ